MQSVKAALGQMWSNLNPSEPSPIWLAKFMAVAIVLFFIAYLIGQS